LLELSPTDINELTANASKLPGTVVLPRWQLNQWFPAAVRSRYGTPGESSEIAIAGAIRRQPTQFVAADKSPLTEGYVAVIPDEPLVYLTLHTF
jgi:hypothetical protein